MPKQLTIFDNSTCSECGEVFPADALNHYELCEECVLDAENLAEFRTALMTIRDGMTPEEKARELEFTRQQALKATLPVPD